MINLSEVIKRKSYKKRDKIKSKIQIKSKSKIPIKILEDTRKIPDQDDTNPGKPRILALDTGRIGVRSSRFLAS